MLTGPRFMAKGDGLTLHSFDPPYRYQQTGKLLWAGPLNQTPQVFTVSATANEEAVKDCNGHVLWAHHYDTPSMTLTLRNGPHNDRDSEGILQDSAGKTLWSGHLDLIDYNYALPKSVDTETYGASRFFYTWGKGQATLTDVHHNVLWTGRPSGNIGLLVNHPDGHNYAETLAIPGPQLPAGKVLTLTFTSADGSVTIMDDKNSVLETLPIPLLVETVTSNNASFNGFFTVGRKVQTPDLKLPPEASVPVTAVYHDTDGQVIATQTFRP